MARVAAQLQNAELTVDFKLENTVEGWQLFSVTFDPARVSTESVRQSLLDAGARIVQAPVGY